MSEVKFVLSLFSFIITELQMRNCDKNAMTFTLYVEKVWKDAKTRLDKGGWAKYIEKW